MAEERTYVIPLRKQWLKVARYRRSKKAVSSVRSFIQKHMKTDDVRLGRFLNMNLWSRGMKHPPHKVVVNAVRVEEKNASYVKVELVGAPEEKLPEKKKKGLAERLKETVSGKEEKPKVEPVKKVIKEVKEEKNEVVKPKEESVKKAVPKNVKKD